MSNPRRSPHTRSPMARSQYIYPTPFMWDADVYVVNEIPRQSYPSSSRHDLYRTQICHYWKNNCCYYGSNCRFAHGEQELHSRPIVAQNVTQQQHLPSYTNLSILNPGFINPDDRSTIDAPEPTESVPSTSRSKWAPEDDGIYGIDQSNMDGMNRNLECREHTTNFIIPEERSTTDAPQPSESVPTISRSEWAPEDDGIYGMSRNLESREHTTKFINGVLYADRRRRGKRLPVFAELKLDD